MALQERQYRQIKICNRTDIEGADGKKMFGQECTEKVILDELPEGKGVMLMGKEFRRIARCPFDTTKLCKFKMQEDYGKCVPGCRICKGLGQVMVKLPVDHPEFGRKLTRCPNKKFTTWTTDTGILQNEWKDMKWSVLRQTKDVKSMSTSVEGLIERGYGWSLFYGPPGNGKSHCSKIAVKMALEKDWTAKYMTQSDLFRSLRAALFDEGNGQLAYEKALNYLAEVKLLVVDEMNRAKTTEWTQEQMSIVWDMRYRSAMAQENMTIWVSNYPPREFLEDHQVDRVFDGRCEVLEISGASQRANQTWMPYKDD